MTRSILTSVALFATTFAAFAAHAETPEVRDSEPSQSPASFQVSLWDSVQVADSARSVHGFKLNLPYGKNQDMVGFDFGIASNTQRNLRGVQLGFGGYVAGKVEGVQLNYVLSIARGDLYGWQDGLYASVGSLTGAQTGFVNHAARSVEGLQIGAVNVARGRAQGAEISAVNVMGSTNGAQIGLVNVTERFNRGASFGVVNYAPKAEGLQLGLVNVTENLHGIQIGAINVAKNGVLPVLPIMNAAL